MSHRPFTVRTRRLAVGLSAVLTAAVLAFSVTPNTQAATSISVTAPKPWVAYQAFPNVRLIRTDGTGDHVLTSVPQGSQEHPDWSPDGKNVVMDVDFQQLWVVGVDGSNPREVYRCVAPCVFLQDASWSPDGSEVAFLRYSAKADGIHARPPELIGLKVQTGQTRVIYREPRASDIPFSPRWSPDGRSIVVEEVRFASDRTDDSEVLGSRVVTMKANGSGVRRELTGLGFGASGVDWSKGGRIVTSSGGNLWTMLSDGTQRRRVTSFDDIDKHAIQPTWVRGTDSIVFTYVRGQFGVDDRPTLGLLRPSGLVVWPEGKTITHPRIQP